MLAETCRISERSGRTTYWLAVRSASLAARLRARRSYTLRSGAIAARTTDARTVRGANTNAQRTFRRERAAVSSSAAGPTARKLLYVVDGSKGRPRARRLSIRCAGAQAGTALSHPLARADSRRALSTRSVSYRLRALRHPGLAPRLLCGQDPDARPDIIRAGSWRAQWSRRACSTASGAGGLRRCWRRSTG